MERRALLATVTLALVLVSHAAAAATASEQRGLRLVERNCGVCHAVRAQGSSRNAQAPPFRELHQRYDVRDLEEALAEGILTGHPAMPEFRFNPREIRDIIAYLRSLEPRRRAAVEKAGPPTFLPVRNGWRAVEAHQSNR